MKLRQIASNMTELEIKDGLTVLFSYETPVACYHNKEGYLKTDKKWSVTTSKHINKWLGSARAAEKPQGFFNNLIK